MGHVARMTGVCSQRSDFPSERILTKAGTASTGSVEPNRIPWFALVIHQYKREQCEQMLDQLGYEYFSPCTSVVRDWSDRQKRMQVPLFPGYIFCRFNPEKRLPLLQIPGILGVVGSGKRLLEVDKAEIEAIRVAVASKLPMEPLLVSIPGQRVKVMQGPLRGLEGLLVRVKAQSRLLLAVTMLNRAVSVAVEAQQLAVQN
jgi:transcription antitermination factor NusG